MNQTLNACAGQTGGRCQKLGGLPAAAFRLWGTLLSAAAMALLVAAGRTASVPAGNLLCRIPYAFACLPAVLCLFACLLAPGTDGPVPEHVYRGVFVRIRRCSAAGLLLDGAALACGAAAAARAGMFSPEEAKFFAAMAAAAGCFAALYILSHRQKYGPEPSL